MVVENLTEHVFNQTSAQCRNRFPETCTNCLVARPLHQLRSRRPVEIHKAAIGIEGPETVCDALKNVASLRRQFNRLPSQVTQCAAEPAQNGTYDNESRQFTSDVG